ncbi:integrase arm-type DNA-binding domain-containing protein [Novosphingobium sp. AAP93]|uniref:tyrosine-type recombinase/integrase n=1 Tax=Novosphingobium sp. AAP93 TaxID=1523427 RepID=UPI0006B9553B|nr:integrase arm-type DNA-binding domain-containing protein [Novosphingobium sp. AAP93]KPF84805.1 integrase [Novosphingobium sp. AAP93]
MLTDLAVRKAVARDKPYKLSDGGGLYLLVTKAGQRCWRVDYRFGEKRATAALGVYPTVTLAEARAKRLEIKKQIAEGINPAAKRKIDKITGPLANVNSFRAVAEEWLDKARREGRADVTVGKLTWLLEFAYPIIGDRKVGEIKAPELLAVLRAVEKRGHYETARRLRSTCGQVFRYAIATGRADRDVSADLRGALIVPKVTHRAAITTPKEAGELLRAIDAYSGYPVTHAALRLAPYVFVRPGELRQAEWSEFDFTRNIWTIAADKTKMRVAHRVPLSRQVLAILEELREITGNRRYLFPAQGKRDRPMCENTINLALRRMGFDGTTMTAHGFRAMASTLLNEQGHWNPDAIERQLGHAETDDVRRAYARGEHWEERIRMMQSWADYLDQLRSGAKVLQGSFRKPSGAASALPG